MYVQLELRLMHINGNKQRSKLKYVKYICRQFRYVVFLHIHVRPVFACIAGILL